MIDLQSEAPLTLNQARGLPYLKGRNGNNISLCTMNRWRTRGVGGIILESAKVGGTIVTTAEAVLRFVERLSDPDRALPTQPKFQRQAAINSANTKLDKAGIK